MFDCVLQKLPQPPDPAQLCLKFSCFERGISELWCERPLKGDLSKVCFVFVVKKFWLWWCNMKYSSQLIMRTLRVAMLPNKYKFCHWHILRRFLTICLFFYSQLLVINSAKFWLSNFWRGYFPIRNPIAIKFQFWCLPKIMILYSRYKCML